MLVFNKLYQEEYPKSIFEKTIWNLSPYKSKMVPRNSTKKNNTKTYSSKSILEISHEPW